MQNARKFSEKLARGEICLGTAVSSSDPSISEALGPEFDFLWIDTEHTAISLESLKCHLMALKTAECAALVRVPWNDPVLIKPVLDIGADGIIVPMVRARELFAESGLTMEQLAERMGYTGDTGRQSVWQFLNRTKDPRLSMLRKFATATESPVEEIVKDR